MFCFVKRNSIYFRKEKIFRRDFRSFACFEIERNINSLTVNRMQFIEMIHFRRTVTLFIERVPSRMRTYETRNLPESHFIFLYRFSYSHSIYVLTYVRIKRVSSVFLIKILPRGFISKYKESSGIGWVLFQERKLQIFPPR